MDRDDPEPGSFEFGSSHPVTWSKVRGAGRRWLVAAVLIAAIAAVAAWLFVYERARVERWLRDTPIALEPAKTTVYRWRDASGGVQITDVPPPDGTPYESVSVTTDANVQLAPKRGRD